MHTLEPYYGWQNDYITSNDARSPFYGYENSRDFYTDHIYDFVIHPEWDNMGSETLFLKILYADYAEGYAIIEFFGEWNDVLHNDIMIFKRQVLDVLLSEGIDKYILVFENVLNFHADATDYYEEWFDDIDDGWIAAINIRKHVFDEIEHFNLDQFLVLGGTLNDVTWRTKTPKQLYGQVIEVVQRRLY